jgi:hypothetical protein
MTGLISSPYVKYFISLFVWRHAKGKITMEAFHCIYTIFHFLWIHPLAFFSGLSTFAISCWSGGIEGLPPGRTFVNSIISVFCTLAFLAAFNQEGHHQLFLPLIGMVVGFIGAERMRNAVLNTWLLHRRRYWYRDRKNRDE